MWLRHRSLYPQPKFLLLFGYRNPLFSLAPNLHMRFWLYFGGFHTWFILVASNSDGDSIVTPVHHQQSFGFPPQPSEQQQADLELEKPNLEQTENLVRWTTKVEQQNALVDRRLRLRTKATLAIALGTIPVLVIGSSRLLLCFNQAIIKTNQHG